MEPAVTQADRRLPSVQVLRGVAASLVVFHHFSAVLQQNAPSHSWIASSGLGTLGRCGVDVFFAISGFIMVYTTGGKAGAWDALVFIQKRALRIYPIYWFWTTVLLALWGAGLALRADHFSAAYVISSYVLVPSFNGRNYHPLVDQGWTLSFEMLFYLVFALAVLLKLKKEKVLFIGVSFGVLALLGRLLPPDNAIRYLVTEPIIIEFLYGVLLGEFLTRMPTPLNSRRVKIASTGLMSIGTLALLCTIKLDFPLSMRFVYYGVPALCIVSGAAMLGTRPLPAFMVYLGDASYSIYITHGFLSLTYASALKRFHVLYKVPSDLAILITCAITIILTSCTYPFVERRLTKALAPLRLRNRKRAPRSRVE